MGIPSFEANGLLPNGRFSCELAELEQVFVHDSQFASSSRRTQIFADFLSALGLLDEIAPRIVERVWLGGGFTTNKPDPDDIDVTFLLNAEVHDGLTLEALEQLKAVLSFGGFKGLGLSVDGFMLVRRPAANPWTRDGGVRDNAAPYMSRRGAWDDWWSRHRVHGTAQERPKVEDAVPRRGYVEVSING